MLWWLLGTVLFVLVSVNQHILVEILLYVLFVSVTLQRHGITDYMVFINMALLSLCNMCGYSRLFMYSCRSHFYSVKGVSGRQLMCVYAVTTVFQSSVWVDLLVWYEALFS